MKPIKPMEPMSPSTIERLMNNNLVQAWLVLVLTICFGASLAGMQITLGPKIEQNKINETREKVPELVMGKEAAAELAASGGEINAVPHLISVQKAAKTVTYNVYEASDAEQNPLGWVVKAKGQGYADNIELLFGLNPELSEITGIFVLEQKETPGLGNKIVTEEWRSQYIGQSSAAPMEVVKGGNAGPGQINAITGATISSKSVTNIINSAIADLKKPLAAKASGGE